MPFRTLVALKCKLGELDALGHTASDDGGTRPQALVELRDSAEPSPRGRVLPALIETAAHLVGLGQPLWLDAHLLSAESELGGQPGGPFAYLDDRIEAKLADDLGLFTPEGPALVPVISDRATDAELRSIAMLQEHHERDVVVRLRNLDAPHHDLSGLLRRVVRGARIDTGRLHAIVDLGFVETVDPARLPQVTSLLCRLIDHLGPGSTTLLAGSVPSARNGFVTTTRERPEVALWLAVAAEVGGLRYGDYGVAHPTARAASSATMRQPYPYLYYTVPGATLSLRRQPAKVDGQQAPGAAAEAFAELAAELVNRPEFAGSDYSWGDQELARCRRGGSQSAGAVPKWLAMATSHHLQHLARHTPDNL